MPSYFLDFTLCLNRDANEKIKEHIIFCCDYLLKHYPKEKVEAIVLTGSLSRGEGTILITSNGSLRTFSDIEFMVVLSHQSDLGKARKTFHSLGEKVSSELTEKGLYCDVSFGATSSKYLRKLGPAMFTVELQKHGKVIWGNRHILKEMPLLKEEDIPRIDALNLLFNRMIEQLIALDKLRHGKSEDLENAIYYSAKMYLDIAGSILTFQGKYEPTYLERARRFRKEFPKIKSSWVKEQLRGFPDRLEFWTDFKMEPSLSKLAHGKKEVTATPSLLREYGLFTWKELAGYVKAAWIWESNQFLGTTWTEDPIALAREYFREENLKAKIRGWAKFAKYAYLYKKRFSMRQMLGLLTHASPQALIRLSGAIIYFNMQAIIRNGQENPEQASLEFVKRHRLSCYSNDDPEKSTWNFLKDEVIDNWQLFVKNV